MAIYNPYHFVPVKPGRHQGDIEKNDFLKGDHQVRHDKYSSDTFSGRLVCRLTTQSPIFVGGNRILDGTIERPGESRHFELPDKEGLPAIPSTTLRGVISSICETAANSALRVLTNEMYSFRKLMDPDDALSAIGMVFVEHVDGKDKYKLRPLTLPTIKTVPGQAVQISDSILKTLYPTPNLKVYIGDHDSIRKDDFYRTYRHDTPEFYGLELTSRSWNHASGFDYDADQHRKKINERIDFLLGQKAKSNGIPKKWDDISDADKNTKYTRGIIRVLGCWGDRSDKIPGNKKHEIFIPYPESEAEKWPLFDILPEAVERFHELADQRTKDEKDQLLPYEPKDTIRNLRPIDQNDRSFRLKTGDLVYFKHSGTSITEISLSSIWRGRVEKSVGGVKHRATTHDFFRSVSDAPDKTNHELLPFNSDRQWVTLAEQLFGFVQQDKKNSKGGSVTNGEVNNPQLALAGRVWFSHARIMEFEGISAYLDPVTLKILDAPKPPSPSMYFKHRDNPKFIQKRKLTPGTNVPQGRKFYLHHRSALNRQTPSEPWKSNRQWVENTPGTKDDHFKQKVRVTPVKSGAVFYFHIDFDNLSRIDLGLLLFALQPTLEFRHKIGMGKSIGLGTVKIEPVGFFEVDRTTRYNTNGLFSPRYAGFWIKDRENWPEIYNDLKGTTEFNDYESIKQEFAKSIDSDILNALRLIGEKDYQSVQTPVVSGGDPEEETFKWFVINDRGNDGEPSPHPVVQQFLKPLNDKSVKIESLQEHPLYPKS